MGIEQQKANLWRADNDVLSSMSLLELVVVQDQEFAQQDEKGLVFEG